MGGLKREIRANRLGAGREGKHNPTMVGVGPREKNGGGRVESWTRKERDDKQGQSGGGSAWAGGKRWIYEETQMMIRVESGRLHRNWSGEHE